MEPKSANRAAQDDADQWFARLSAPDCTADERMAFQRWRAHPENAAAYAVTEELWGSIGGLRGDGEFDALARQALADTEAPASRQRRFFWPGAIAASLGVCIIGLTFSIAMRHWTPEVTYTTESGERSTVQLPDGSRVILNAATELRVRINRDTRQFTLRQGEALFDVAQDPGRPFAVSVADSKVVALGTRFQIRNEARNVTVTLLDGRIRLDRPDLPAPILQTPGEQIRFSTDRPQIARRTVDPDVVASWSTGRLRFRGTPLSEVLAEVNRYADLQIRIADTTLDAATPISGTFEIGDSLSVVSALQSLLRIGYERRGQELLLHRN